jgi:DNA-binding NarL/FixJ family response regulator
MPPLTVVVVDDEPDYRQIVRSLLLGLPDVVSIVGEAADGQEGLAVVLRERPDIVVTDLMMPGLNCVDLTRLISQELPQTRIIINSSYPEDANRLKDTDSGADAFVNKRVVFEALVPAIRDLIGRGLAGGSGPLPPNQSTSSSSAAAPK